MVVLAFNSHKMNSFKAAAAVRDDLKDHIILLIEQFVKSYGKTPEAKV